MRRLQSLCLKPRRVAAAVQYPNRQILTYLLLITGRPLGFEPKISELVAGEGHICRGPVVDSSRPPPLQWTDP